MMKKRQGLTLIEIILSISLLGIIALVILTIFNTGTKNIIKAGDRTEDVLTIQDQIDEKIRNHTDEGESIITISIPEIGEKEIQGSFIRERVDGIEITTFIPNKSSFKGE